MSAGVQFFQVYSDIGAGKHGTIEGVSFLSNQLAKTYPNATTHKIYPQEHHERYDYKCAKYVEYLTPFFEQTLLPKLKAGLKACKQAGDFPVIISGDHANAMGNVSAFINHHHGKKIGIVWIDAHADLHSVYTTPSGNLHGMPLGAILGLDNETCAINTIDSDTEGYWHRLKGLSTSPIDPKNVVFLGLRSFEPPEQALIDQHQMPFFSAIDHRNDFDGVLTQVCEHLADLDAVYVSFDVDALDDALVPATGTPVENGYESYEIKAIFDKLLPLPCVKLFEITEFNPTLDDDEGKYALITELLTHAIDLVQHKADSTA